MKHRIEYLDRGKWHTAMLHFDSWLPKLIRMAGITLGKHVYLKIPDQTYFVLLNHELIHVIQWRRYWYIGFLPVYVAQFAWQFLKCWHWMKAYRRIPLEREAKRKETEYRDWRFV